MTETIPEPYEVDLDYRAKFDEELDAYVVEAELDGIKITVTLPLLSTDTSVATILAALPQVLEGAITIVDETLEERADG